MLEFNRREVGGLIVGAGAMAATRSWSAEPVNWRLGFQTPSSELDANLSLVSGRLPADLEGVFYRIGPAQFERAGETLGHWFDGDGMIQRFAIGAGKIRHRGRFINTGKRAAEEAAGRFLYSGFGFSPENSAPVSRPDDINAANTSVIKIGSEVWALWEGGSPWRVNAEDLETIGRQAFSDPFDGLPFSAHPKQGPDGDIWNFGALGSRCVIWHIGADGVLKSATPIDLPVPSLMHDFAVTQRHIVLLLPPLLFTGGEGGSLIDKFTWRPDNPLRVLVMDKDDLSRQRIYELPARFLFHVGNAWEDGSGVIRVDAFLDGDSRFATKTARELPQGKYSGPPDARLTMLALYPDGRSEMEMATGTGEFPRTDPRRVGRQHRYTYGVTGSGVARWDWRSGQQATHIYSADHWSEEPVFVPKSNSTREANGWVLATTLNTRAERTELAVFNARYIDDGPIALFACPYVLPLGFHGAFVGD